MSTTTDVATSWPDTAPRVAVIEMRRGPHNFFDRDLLTAVADAAHSASGAGARAIVLCSEGKNFCAGADFGGTEMTTDRRATAASLYEQGARLFDLDVPLVAAVQGKAVGGGLGLACAADFRIATPDTRFHANFATLGFHHGFALTATLPRIVGAQRAAWLLYSATPLPGTQAAEYGLAELVVPAVELRARAVSFAAELAAPAPLAVAAMRRTLRAPLLAEVRTVLAHELDEQTWLWETEDSRNALAAVAARRTPTYLGR